MRTIHKFPLTVGDTVALVMPAGAIVRHVGTQKPGGGNLCVWAEVDTSPAIPKVERVFHIRGTGHPVPTGGVEFVATVIDGPFVWHVWRDI